MRKIIISSSFGHEVMAVAIAKSMNLSVVVVPNKDNAEDFHKESVPRQETGKMLK